MPAKMLQRWRLQKQTQTLLMWWNMWHVVRKTRSAIGYNIGIYNINNTDSVRTLYFVFPFSVRDPLFLIKECHFLFILRTHSTIQRESDSRAFRNTIVSRYSILSSPQPFSILGSTSFSTLVNFIWQIVTFILWKSVKENKRTNENCSFVRAVCDSYS